MAQVVEAEEYQRAKTEGYRKLRPKVKSQPLRGMGQGSRGAEEQRGNLCNFLFHLSYLPHLPHLPRSPTPHLPLL